MSNSLKKLLTEFKYLEQNSINIKKGSIFLAYPGENKDGRNYIDEAIKKGAGAIIYDPLDFEWDAQWKLPNLPVKKLKDNISNIASEFYNNPSKKINLINKLNKTKTNNKKSLVYIDDVVNAIFEVTNNSKASLETFNITSPVKTSTRNLYNLLRESLGLKSIKFEFSNLILVSLVFLLKLEHLFNPLRNTYISFHDLVFNATTLSIILS